MAAHSDNNRHTDAGGEGGSPRDVYHNREGLFRRSESMAEVTGRLVTMLDQVEQRVELLREHAAAMEQERECLLGMIKTIQGNKDLVYVSQGEREEIEVTAGRLLNRCLTVAVQVTTPRNPIQEKALQQANCFIDELVNLLRTDLEGSVRSCQSYLNACLPEARGTVDQKFQAVIIECTADDQKKIRKRLESLMRTIRHAGNSL